MLARVGHGKSEHEAPGVIANETSNERSKLAAVSLLFKLRNFIDSETSRTLTREREREKGRGERRRAAASVSWQVSQKSFRRSVTERRGFHEAQGKRVLGWK